MPKVGTASGFKAKVEAEHRDGICEVCGERMVRIPDPAPIEREEVEVHLGELVGTFQLPDKLLCKIACPKCGGTKGNLIARSISIQAPSPPQCIRFRCVWRFFCQTIFCGLLSQYHYRRVAYAEKNRHKNIPLKYRTGEGSPENIKQAIFAIIKLKLRR